MASWYTISDAALFCESRYGGLFNGLKPAPGIYLPEWGSTISAFAIVASGIAQLACWEHASGLLRFTSATLIVNGISSALVHATSGQEFSHIDGQSLVAVVCMILCLLFRELYFVCVTLLKIWLAKGEAAQYPHHQKVATRLITSTSGKGGWQRASLFYILPASLMWWAVGYRPNDVGFPTFTVLMVALSLTCITFGIVTASVPLNRVISYARDSRRREMAERLLSSCQQPIFTDEQLQQLERGMALDIDGDGHIGECPADSLRERWETVAQTGKVRFWFGLLAYLVAVLLKIPDGALCAPSAGGAQPSDFVKAFPFHVLWHVLSCWGLNQMLSLMVVLRADDDRYGCPEYAGPSWASWLLFPRIRWVRLPMPQGEPMPEDDCLLRHTPCWSRRCWLPRCMHWLTNEKRKITFAKSRCCLDEGVSPVCVVNILSFFRCSYDQVCCPGRESWLWRRVTAPGGAPAQIELAAPQDHGQTMEA